MANENVCVVIPCRNEADNIRGLVEDVLRYAGTVVVVDDQSTDGTYQIAVDAGADVVRTHPQRDGLAAVYRTGLLYALELNRASIIIEMDAGGSHSPSDIRVLLEGFNTTGLPVDAVTSRRFGYGASYDGRIDRMLLSYFGTWLFNVKHNTWLQDATGGFIAYRRRALQKLIAEPYKSRGHFYQSEMRSRLLQMGGRIVEVPIRYKGSRSSLKLKSVIEALRLLWT